MRHEPLAEAGPFYAPCRYGASRLYFRGPERRLDGSYVAFIGGTETYGKFIDRPFPALTEDRLAVTCVNFGVANASIDAFLHEPVVMDAAREAMLVVVQIMGAQNMSNRFYTVHPRRNDRFIKASTVLRAIYPEVDFSDFCFTRHMLGALLRAAPERFAIVREELQAAWAARMRSFLAEIGPRALLLWFSDRLPSDTPWEDRADPLSGEPLFVTRRMVDALRPLVRGVVMMQPSARALARGTEGMVFTPIQEAAAAGLPGPLAHAEAAEALEGAIRTALGTNRGPVARAAG